jgi:hypothetical protein
MRKYAIIYNDVVAAIEQIKDEDVANRAKEVQMLIDVEDMVPAPSVGWVLNGNKLEIPQNLGHREIFEIDLNRRKSKFGLELAQNAVDRMGARNKILNKTGSQVSALLNSLLVVKSLMETGALGTARGMCSQLKAPYSEYADIFDFVIEQINWFEGNFGL